MKPRILLIGCGAEIGSTLVTLESNKENGFSITDVLTNPIEPDPKHPHLSPLDSLVARIILANPTLIDQVSVDYTQSQLIIAKRKININWGDVREKTYFENLKSPYDLIILATSKKHLADKALTDYLAKYSRWVVGVAEAPGLPVLYPNLIGLNSKHLKNQPRPVNNNKVFAFGSCQSNGWHAQLRPLLELADKFEAFDMKGVEVDIFHPDTPTGRLGTKSIEARSQDPRNNLRPSFSQIEKSMRILFPGAHHLNTVSLRILIHPPGYQICRFTFTYKGNCLSQTYIKNFFETSSKEHHEIFKFTNLPLGSRAYEFSNASAIILGSDKFFKYYENPYSIPLVDSSLHVGQVITQAYVNNVRGYCYSVLRGCDYLLLSENIKCFEGE